jgi:tripartite-type tricarboxylate transporter receptor subunit TctC
MSARYSKTSNAAVVLFFLICAMGLVLSANANAQTRRVALVIGNAAYAEGALRNPVNDARLMEATLKELGFSVEKVENANFQRLQRSVREFGTRAQGAEVALVFFAGHGVQSEGENFLLPIGAQIDKEADLASEAVTASTLLRQLEGSGARVSLIILDACRNNPFRARTRSQSRGLARMEALSGSIVAYAAQSNAVADDGSGANGLYTTHLVANLRQPNLDIKQVFERTAIAVEQASGGKQRPREDIGLRGFFALNGKASETIAMAPQAVPAPLPQPTPASANPVVSSPRFVGINAPGNLNEASGGFPNKPIRIIVPYAPGGAIDVAARSLADSLVNILGQPVVIENKPGAAGSIGAQQVAIAPNDGYTLLLTNSSLAFGPSIFSRPSYSYDQFTTVARVAHVPMMVAANPKSGIRNFSDLAASFRKTTPVLNIASSGHAGLSHFCLGGLEQHFNGKASHIPYRGSAPAISDLVGGHADIMCDVAVNFKSHLASGNLIAIAVSSQSNNAQYAGLPVLRFEIPNWLALFAPKGTPSGVVGRIFNATERALQDPNLISKLREFGAEPVSTQEINPNNFAGIFNRDAVRFAELARTANIKAD